jgi:hypothetical protein
MFQDNLTKGLGELTDPARPVAVFPFLDASDIEHLLDVAVHSSYAPFESENPGIDVIVGINKGKKPELVALSERIAECISTTQEPILFEHSILMITKESLQTSVYQEKPEHEGLSVHLLLQGSATLFICSEDDKPICKREVRAGDCILLKGKGYRNQQYQPKYFFQKRTGDAFVVSFRQNTTSP